MRREIGTLILGTLLVLLLAFFGFAALAAQESTPEPGVTVDVETPGDSDVQVTVEAADGPAIFTLISGMAGATFAFIEVVKNAFLRKLSEVEQWSLGLYSVVNLAIAFGFSLLLLHGAGPGVNIFAASGWSRPVGNLYAMVVTAFLMAGGSAILHGGYDFLRSSRGVAVVTENPDAARAAAIAARRR